MDGAPIIGTYIIFVTRTIAAASLVSAITYIVPRHHKQVAIIAAALVSAAAVGFLVFVSIQVANEDLRIGPDGWYKHILDTLSIICGAIAGAWLANQNQRKERRSS